MSGPAPEGGEEMISLDPIVLGFVKNNFITIGLALMFLKGLAQVTPWKWDEKIVDLISAMFTTLKKE
jgi:hypothetical protein